MPELRKDPILDQWVIISTERSRRPSEFRIMREKRAPGGFCPFCPGNEYTTPPEVYALRPPGSAPDSPDWTLRVVPNKFPALEVEGGLERAGRGMYDRMNGLGAHEVIIETPSHDQEMASMSTAAVMEVLRAYRIRLVDLEKDRRFSYVLAFKNHGAIAGATLEHSHSQLIALPVVPKLVREELAGSKAYFSFRERCVFCDMIAQEKSTGERLIAENRHFAALAPFASRFPFEMWIIPKGHSPTFEKASEEVLQSLSSILRGSLRSLGKVLHNPDYNFMIHTAPFRSEVGDFYHWHLELIPVLTRVAGFEWGTGFFINPTLPEEAARMLREEMPPEEEGG